MEQVTDPATNSEAKKAKRKKRKDKEEILVEPIITPKNILSSLRNVYFMFKDSGSVLAVYPEKSSIRVNSV